jgi:hypothetical protein
MQAIQMLQLNNRFVLLSITEQQKREQETPEETIDMTYPVEGGSDETDLKQQNDSGDTIQPKDIKTGDLEEWGSAKPVYAGTDGVKRRYSSQIVSYKNKL